MLLFKKCDNHISLTVGAHLDSFICHLKVVCDQAYIIGKSGRN
jgi:hypothetical protein